MGSRARGFANVVRRRLLRTAVCVALIAILVGLLLEAAVIELVPLGPWFRRMMAVVAPVVAILTAFCLVLLKPRAAGCLKSLANTLSWPLALVLMLAIVAPVAFPRLSERLSRASDAEAALQEFYVSYSPNLEHARVERTLAEFERARRRLEGQWPRPEESSPITLHLFQTLREYRTAFASDLWSGGGTYCGQNGVVIGVPLEEPSEREASRTPLHEMVHATMCQSLGTQAFYSIPRWFHEGMAQLYEGDGFAQLDERALNRLTVWLKRRDVMTAEAFCGYTPRDSPAEVSLFYDTAWEFARSLEASHGRNALNTVVAEVAYGRAFEDSLQTHFSGTCTRLYADWSQGL